MHPLAYQTRSRFAVEGLESRILLSAVPMDAVVSFEEEPNVYEVQLIGASEEQGVDVSGLESQGSLWEGARELATSEESPSEILILTADGVENASGQIVQDLASGMELVADEIRVADGAVLDSVSIKADIVVFGETTWKGDNVVDAGELSFTGTQTASAGATLDLSPVAEDASIWLGESVDTIRFGLDREALSLLSDAGFEQLSIGSDTGSHTFEIDGLEYDGNLALKTPVGEGTFNIRSAIIHTGGTLSYYGTGNTQNTSADTLTNGVPITVNDSVELVYTVGNANAIRIDTASGGVTAGAHISITGDLRGTDEDGGGTLTLNAGTGGRIRIEGNIGTSKALERIVIENAAEVEILGNIQVEEFIIQNVVGSVTLGTSAANFITIEGQDADPGELLIGGDASDAVGSATWGVGGDITVEGDLQVVDGDATFRIDGTSGSRQLWLKGEVSISAGDLTIEEANRVLMSSQVLVSDALVQTVGHDNTIFEDNLSAGSINLISENEIRFEGDVLLLTGDLTLITNDINFLGGASTVTGALNNSNLPISNAYFRPSTEGGEMNIGTPVGAGSNFSFNGTDIAALEDGWNSINFGYQTGTTTNLARIGSAGFLDVVRVDAGSFLVNGPFSARTSLTLNAVDPAPDADMEFTDGAVVSVINEQVSNVWQSSAVNLTADHGDIIFNNGAFVLLTNTENPDSSITMTATEGSILDQSANPGFQEARDLNLTAAADILLYTNVENLWAHSTTSGDIEINELDGLYAHSVITVDGAIDLDTGGLTQVDLARSQRDHADNTVTVSALGSVLIGQIFAGTLGNVSVTAEDQILRVTGLLDAGHRVEGNLLTLEAENGIGTIAEPLFIRANSLDGDNLTAGDIRITQDATRAALTVDLANDSTTDGDLVSLDVLGANVTVTALSNDADGGVFLGVVGDILQNGTVASASGIVRMTSTGAVQMASGSATQSNGGDVALSATTSITMAADASVVSSSGDVIFESPGDIMIGTFDARDDSSTPGAKTEWGDVALIAGGWLRDDTSSAVVNIYADQIHLRGVNGIGQLPDSGNERTIEVDARVIGALVVTSGELAIHATSDLITGVPSTFAYDVLDKDGNITAGALAVDPLAGIANTGSDGEILMSSAGSLTLKTNEAGTDSSAIETTAAATVVLVADSLSVEDAILSNGGSISADVTNTVTVGAEVAVTTSGAGTIAIRSSADSILAAADSTITAANTNVVLSAQNNIELGSISAVGGDVGLNAVTGSIEAATGGTNTRTVVTSDTLSIVAGDLVDGPEASGERFNVSVNTLSLTGSSGSDYRIDNDKNLIIDTTSASAQLYDSVMTLGALAIASQSNFAVSGEGNIDLNIQGNLTLAAARELSTTGAGDIDLDISGTFSMGALSLIENENGVINATAGGTMSIARVSSTDGDITFESETGALIDSDPVQTAVVDFSTAGTLTLTAATGIGIESNDRDTLNVTVGRLNTTTVSGGIFVASASSFTIDGVSATGTAVPVIITSGGTLTIENTVSTTGDLVLRADSDLTQDATSTITAGADVALRSGAAMTLARVVTPGDVALEVTNALSGYANPTNAAIQATSLLLNGVGSVATPAQPLLTNVSRIAGQVTGGTVALSNETNLAIGAITVETIPVGTADTLPLVARDQSGDRLLVSGSGDGVFVEVTGTLLTESVTDPSLETTEALPVLFDTTGAQTWNGRFSLGGGAVTLRAGGAVTLDASGTFTTSGGSLLVENSGPFTIEAVSIVSRGAGNLIVDASDTITINGQITGTGHAALISGDSILVGGANSVEATDLILVAAQGIASSSQSLVSDADRLAVRTGASGVFVENSGDLTVMNLGFSVTSLAPGAVENVAFSGYVGGVIAYQGGRISISSGGNVVVDPIAANFSALSGTELAFDFVVNEAGSSGNGISVIVLRDSTEYDQLVDEFTADDLDRVVFYSEGTINSVFDPADRSLVVSIENGVDTVGELLSVINNHPSALGTAVLAGGLLDGSTVFDLPALTSSAFTTSGGSEDGVRTEVAGTLAGGAEPIASSSELLVPDEFFTIRVTSEVPGASINNVSIRLLNEGPIEVADGGRLNPGTNAAIIEWDGSDFLDIYVNFGYTTVGTVIDRINEQVGIPFGAELGGTFGSESLDVVLGDAPVTMESDLRAGATLRPIGSNNDILVTAASSGPLFNGITFTFYDNGTVPENGAVATFDPVLNIMTINVQSGVTTATQVVDALNLQGTFVATLTPELAELNDGTGAIQAQRFLSTGGAVAVQATVSLQMVGSDNDVTLTSVDPGDDFNNIEVRMVGDTNALPGSVTVDYDGVEKILTLTVNPLFTSAAQVVDAVNAATTPFTATSNGSGSFELAEYPTTSGGTGSVARAEFFATGDNNDFEINAITDSTIYIDTRVFLIDDGTITDGSAVATYSNDPRLLIINIESGVTSATTVLAAINDAAIPMTATLLSGNDGSGVYNLEAAVFAGGVDPISAVSTVELPSGASATVTADEGGIAANGVQVAFAIDASLAADSASVAIFELGGKRILQLRVDSATTQLSTIAAALTADAAVPYSLTGDLASAVGDLAPMEGALNEGSITVSANGSISLVGAVDSQTGRVVVSSTTDDLTFDSTTARIIGIDGVAITLGGSFANLASLESPLIEVYGDALLSLSTGSLAVPSTESVFFRSGGDISVTGGGFTMRDGFIIDRSIRLEATNDITVDAPIRSVAGVTDADGIMFTVVKSTVDGGGAPLTESVPVVIEESGGDYTIYALPDVATHADIVNAINALQLSDLSVFFASLGRQEGTLAIGDHNFFITSLADAVIQNVSVSFADLGSDAVEVSFAGSTLTIRLDQADDATVADVLAAIDGLNAFSATTSTIDTSSLLRGADAREFVADYTIDIVGDAGQVDTVTLDEVAGAFTASGLIGTATRLDLLNSFVDTGLFAGSVPVLDARLLIDGNTYYLNTSSTLTSVNLSVGFVSEGTLETNFDEGTGVLDLTLNNVDAPSAQDIFDALEALDFIVYSTVSDLSAAIDTATAVADLQSIASGERTAALTFGSPINLVLPVGADGVFADILFDVEGMLLALNWVVPTVAPDFTITTSADSLSSSIVDDVTSPSATLSYGATGVFASSVLTIDGVDIAIAAKSASIELEAGRDVSITATGLLGGGTVSVSAENDVSIVGAVEGGELEVAAEGDVTQSGSIEATGTGDVNVSSATGSITMSGAATTASVSGSIFYQASGDVALVSLASTDAGRIDVVSGAAISDSLSSGALNISTSGFVALTAQTGVGAVGSDAINVVTGQLQLRNFGTSGDIVVTEENAGATLAVTELTQNATAGWSILEAVAGGVVFEGPVTHLSNGALLVQASASITTQNTAPVSLNGGLLTFLAGTDISLNADLETAGGDAWLAASTGSLAMASGTALNAGSGDVLLNANTNVTVAQIETTADVRVEATTGSIVRATLNDRTNVLADNLQLEAGASVGSLAAETGALITEVALVNATAASGVLAVRERNGLNIGESSFDVAFAQAAKTTSSDTFSESRWVQAGAGNSVLRVGGALTIESITAVLPTISVAGNALIDVTDAVVVDGSVAVTGGSLQWFGGDTFGLNANLSVTGGSLNIDIDSNFTQLGTATITVSDENAIIDAGGTMTVGSIDVGAGDLALTSFGTLDQQTAQLLEAAQLRLSAGSSIASSTTPLNFDTTRLTAVAGGSMFLLSENTLIVDTVAAIEVDSVTVLGAVGDAVTAVAQSDLTTNASNGAVVLELNSGNLTLNGGLAGVSENTAISANGSGNILLDVPGALVANADILSSTGHVTLTVDGNITFNATADIQSGGTGTFFVESTTGSLTLDDNSQFATGSGDVVVRAAQNITVGGINTTGSVALIATSGAIIDGGDTYVDVIADGLLLQAGTSIGGAGADALDTSVAKLSARAANGGIYISETDGLIVDDTSAVAFRVLPSSGTVASPIANQSDLVTLAGNGSILIQLAAGDFVLNDGTAADDDTVVSANGSGNVLLQTLGGTLTANADILTGSGHISVLSSGAMSLAENISVTTSGLGSVSFVSTGGALTQNVGGTITTGDGDIILEADGDVSIAALVTNAKVGIVSVSGAIIDNEGARTNVTADTLLMRAGTSIGTGAKPIETEVAEISADAQNGGIFVSETNAIDVTTTDAETSVVLQDGTTQQKTYAPQSGLSGTSSGAVVLTNKAGDITVVAGNTVTAAITGHILLAAAANLDINANVESDSGNVTLRSAGDFTLAASVTVSTGLGGEIFAFAGGVVNTGADSRFINSAGNVVVAAADTITLSGVQSEGNVALFSLNGSILTAGSTAFDREVIGSHLLFRADNGGVGSSAVGQTFRTNVDRLSASTRDGVYLTNAASLRVDEVSVSYQFVNPDGNLAAEGTLSFGDQVTATGATREIRLVVESGNLVLGQLSADSVYTNVVSGSIIDGGYTTTQVVSEQSELIASGSIGGAGDAKLDTEVSTLALSSGASVFIGNAATTLSISTVGSTVGATAANDLVIESSEAIEVDQAFDATAGNGLLSALSGDLTLNAAITSGQNLSLLASGSVQQEANVSAGGTLDVEATAGAFSMLDAVTAISVGNLRVIAGTSILVGGLSGANISLDAGTWIDTAGSTHTDLTADNVQLTAGSYIGQIFSAGNGAIQSSVNKIAAVAGNGGFYIDNDKALAVGVVPAINVNRVQIDGNEPEQLGGGRSGVTASLSVMALADGNLTIDSNVTATAGNLLFKALSGNIALNAAVSSGDSATILASGGVTYSSVASVTAGGTFDVQAEAGAIAMADGSSVSAAGNVRYLASGDIRLGGVSGANAHINAGGAIFDNGDSNTDLTASQVQLIAGGAIGEPSGTNFGLLETTIQSLAVQSGAGVFVDNSGSLQLSSVSPITLSPSPLDSVGVAQPGVTLSGLSGAGAVVLTTEETFVIDHAISVSSSSNVLLEARGDDSDISISAAVETAGGNLSILAGRDLTLSTDADLTVSVAPGTIDLEARTGSIDQDASLTVSTVNANILIYAYTDVSLGMVEAGSASVAITAETGSITDNKDRTANTPNNITSGTLILVAANDIGLIGAGVDNPIETRVGTLAAITTVGGSINIREFDGLIVDTINSFSANRVGADSLTTTDDTTVASRSDVRTAGNGSIILRSVGSTTLNGGLANEFSGTSVSAGGTGNVLIEVLAINGDIQANGAIVTAGGNISSLAGRGITLAGNADLIVESGSGSIDLNAARGSIIQGANLVGQTAGGNILFRARDDINLGLLDARTAGAQSEWGVVGLVASTGSIFDSKARSSSDANILASAANISAAEGIGRLGEVVDNAIEVDLLKLSAVTTGAGAGININELSGLDVDFVETFTVNRVAADATTGTSSTTVVGRSDITTGSNGDIVLVVSSGGLNLNDGSDADGDSVVANGSGRVLLDTASGNLFVFADVHSSTGVLTLHGGTNIGVGGGVTISSSADVSLDAASGILFMAGTANVIATGSDARLSSALDLTVGNVTAATVSLVSGEDIVNAAGSSKNVIATNLRIESVGSVGVSSRHLSTDIDNLSAVSSTGSIYITETDGVTVRDVALTVTELLPDATTTTVTDAAQSDLVAGSNGDIVLVVSSGDLNLKDGSDADGDSVVADGSGRVLLDTASGNLFVFADVHSSTGVLTLHGGTNIGVGVGGTISSSADVSLDAASGILFMAGTANVIATGSDARLSSTLDLTVGNVAAATVSLVSGEDIVNSSGSTMNVTATSLRIESVGSVGVSSRHLSTDIDNLSAMSSTGSIYITETDGVTVRDVALTVTELLPDATTTTVNDGAQSDLVTGSNGDIVLVATLGDIALTDGSDVDGDAVRAIGSGFIQIDAISGALVMDGGVSVTSTGSDARLSAALDVTLGNVLAATVSLVSGEDIVNAVGSTTNVSATNLRIESTGSVGVSSRHLTTSVDTLTVFSSGGSIFITESNGVTVGTVSPSFIDAAQSDLVTGSNGDIVLFATLGDIALTDGSDADGDAVRALGSGFIQIDAISGAIVMDGGVSVTSTGSDARLSAALDVTLGNVLAATVSLVSGEDIVNAVGSTTNVTATNLRIESTGSVGVTSRNLTTSVDTLSVFSSGGSIFITEFNGVTVGTVSPSFIDAAQSDLVTGSNGDIVLVATLGDITLNDGSDSDGLAVAASGGDSLVRTLSGHVLVNASIQSAAGGVSIIAAQNVTFSSGADILVGSNGTIDLYAEAGVITLASDSSQTANGGDIRFEANGDITLGGTIQTQGNVRLVSATGGVVDSDANGSVDVISAGLLVSASLIGSAANAIDINVDQFAGDSAGGVYFTESDSLTIGTVATIVQRVADDGTTTAVVGSSQTGLVSSAGEVVGIANSDISVELVQSGVSITLSSLAGAILDGDGASVDLVAPVVTLNSASGIGQNGSGALDVDADTLAVTNTGIGSVYLSLLSDTSLTGADLQDAGSLLINQSSGNLAVDGVVNVSGGRAQIATLGSLTINSDVTASDYLRTASDSLNVSGAVLTVSQGSADIRVRNNLDFATDASLVVSDDSTITVGGILTTNDITVGGDLTIRAQGDILRNGGQISAGNLKIGSGNGQIGASSTDPIQVQVGRLDAVAAGEINISDSDGFDFGRTGLDTSGSNSVNVDIASGEFGSVTGSFDHGGSGTFKVTSGGDLTVSTVITSTGGGAVDIAAGSNLSIGQRIESTTGSIALSAGSDVELGDLVKSESGNVSITANRVLDGSASEDILIEARNGRVTINASAGIGTSGSGDIEIAADELSTRTTSGTLSVELRRTTELVGNGLRIDSGSGQMILNQTSGSLVLNANMRHFGSGLINLDTVGSLTLNGASQIRTASGNIDIDVSGNVALNSTSLMTSSSGRLELDTQGSLTMSSGSRFTTGSGVLDVFSRNTFRISQVSTSSGTIRLQSANGGIDKVTSSSSFPNIISSSRPDVLVDTIADFVVQSSSVSLNGAIIPRSSNTSFIVISLVLS